MRANADNYSGGFNDERDKIVELMAKLLGDITHSISHFASTERSELSAYSAVKFIGRDVR